MIVDDAMMMAITHASLLLRWSYTMQIAVSVMVTVAAVAGNSVVVTADYMAMEDFGIDFDFDIGFVGN